jgi:hypothetical protein
LEYMGLNKAFLSFVFATAVLTEPAYAGTTGVLSGRIINLTGNGVAGARVLVLSRAEVFAVTTNAHGFYSVLGVPQSTYVVTINVAGYEGSLFRNVTINADQTSTLNVRLSSWIDGFARGTMRSAMAAFQPSATTDQYTLDTARIRTQLGH